MPVDEPNTAQPQSQVTATSPETPGTSPNVATAPPADGDRPIPLGPIPARPRARLDERRRHVVDLVLVGLALLLAFALAARPVRNSDVLMHLAAGRDLLQGNYNPFTGQNPYSVDPDNSHWVNHSWLLDAIFYLLQSAVGISGLVVVKGLLAVLLCAVLISTGRVGKGLWLPALMAAIAVLVISPRLLLQPAVVSFLFLALTVWFLQRGGRWNYRPDAEPDRPVTWKDYWAIPVLFIAWVNLDEWFFLGPLTVLLYAIGRSLDRGREEGAPREGEVKALGITALAGILACLINPQHVLAFTLPPQLGLSPTAQAIRSDDSLRPFFVHGFDTSMFQAGNISVARLSYFVLILIVLVSFAVNFRGLRWWRALLVLAFLALSAWHGRSVPFFAVVAGPVAALNFQELARRRERGGLAVALLPALGRVFGTFLLIVLIVCDWPGWLQTRPYEQHRLSLADELDPSLKEIAEDLARLHRDGILAEDARSFPFSAELGNALAWYAPEVKCSFDNRVSPFGRDTARDWADVRRGLLQSPPDLFREHYENKPVEDEGERGWRAILNRQEVDHIILYDANQRLLNPLIWLTLSARGPEESAWVLLHHRGNALVYGRRSVHARHRLAPERKAYSPSEEDQLPGEGPEPPAPPPFWQAFTQPPASRSPDADEAATQYLLFRAHRGPIRQQYRQVLRDTLAASCCFTSAVPGGPLVALPSLRINAAYKDLADHGRPRPGDSSRKDDIGWSMFFDNFLTYRDDGPPENLILAIRAARRALNESPNNYRAHAALGEVYHATQLMTRERVWAQPPSGWMSWLPDTGKGSVTAGPFMLAQLRHVQAVAGLQSTLLFRKDLQLVHHDLADLYGMWGILTPSNEKLRGFADLELEHRKLELKYARQTGPRSGETADDYRERILGLQKFVDGRDKAVKAALDKYEIQRQRLTAVDERASQAHQMSLAGKALEELLKSDYAGIGPRGMRLQIELALMMGRVRDVKFWFQDNGEDTMRARLGNFNYHWLSTLLAAGLGDYDAADEHLKQIASSIGRNTTYARWASRYEVPVRFPQPRKSPGTEPPEPQPEMTPEQALALVIGKALLAPTMPPSARLGGIHVYWMDLSIEERTGILVYLAEQVLFNHVEEANVHFLRGLLAIEQGNRKRAEEAFRLADALPLPISNILPGRAPLPVQTESRNLLQKLAGK